MRRASVRILHHKWLLFLNLSLLVISGLSFGAGISMLLPIFSLMLKDGVSLSEMIQKKMTSPVLQPVAHFLLKVVPEDRFQAFVVVMSCVAILTVISAAAKYAQGLVVNWTIARVIQYWQRMIMEKVCRMKLEESWVRSSSDLLATLLFEPTNLGGGLNHLMGLTANALIRVAASLIVAFSIDWRVTSMVLASIAVIGASVAIINRQIRKVIAKENDAKAFLLVDTERIAANPMTIKTSCSEFRERRKFHYSAQMMLRFGFRRVRIRSLSSNMNELLGTLGLCVVASIVAHWILRSGYSADTFMTVMAVLVASLTGLKPLSEFTHDMQIADVSSERMFAVYDNLKCEPISWKERQKFPKLARLSQSLEFQNITYTYPGKHDPAIRDLSLSIKAGEFVAIVGANGSGKSTLVLLLSRMVAPQQGRILFDGQDIASVDLRSLRQQMTMVAQKTVLFQGSIADNIAYGIPWTSREEIIAAAKIATADEFILEMPNQYDMVLGPQGAGVSGGQAQRICIARAILRDPAILILDEATSQVDPESEGRIAQAMAQITKGRTTIAIAHRLSTVRNADRIIVMDQGRIVAQGTHRELLESSDDYRSIAQTQMNG